VAFQAELALEGGVHGFDDLADRAELACSAPWFLSFHGRADQFNAVVVEASLELG